MSLLFQKSRATEVSSHGLAHAGTPLTALYEHMTWLDCAATTHALNAGMNDSHMSRALTLASKLFRFVVPPSPAMPSRS